MFGDGLAPRCSRSNYTHTVSAQPSYTWWSLVRGSRWRSPWQGCCLRGSCAASPPEYTPADGLVVLVIVRILRSVLGASILQLHAHGNDAFVLHRSMTWTNAGLLLSMLACWILTSLANGGKSHGRKRIDPRNRGSR